MQLTGDVQLLAATYFMAEVAAEVRAVRIAGSVHRHRLLSLRVLLRGESKTVRRYEGELVARQ